MLSTNRTTSQGFSPFSPLSPKHVSVMMCWDDESHIAGAYCSGPSDVLFRPYSIEKCNVARAEWRGERDGTDWGEASFRVAKQSLITILMFTIACDGCVAHPGVLANDAPKAGQDSFLDTTPY